jgi:zinc transporter ZupT
VPITAKGFAICYCVRARHWPIASTATPTDQPKGTKMMSHTDATAAYSAGHMTAPEYLKVMQEIVDAQTAETSTATVVTKKSRSFVGQVFGALCIGAIIFAFVVAIVTNDHNAHQNNYCQWDGYTVHVAAPADTQCDAGTGPERAP